MLISVQGTGKNYLQSDRESMGDAPVLSPVSWIIVVKEKPTVGSPLFGAFPSAASLRRRWMSMCISLLTVAILVNYTSEFRELFEATTYFKSANLKQNALQQFTI
jgi:hypothetical protein